MHWTIFLGRQKVVQRIAGTLLEEFSWSLALFLGCVSFVSWSRENLKILRAPSLSLFPSQAKSFAGNPKLLCADSWVQISLLSFLIVLRFL